MVHSLERKLEHSIKCTELSDNTVNEVLISYRPF